MLDRVEAELEGIRSAGLCSAMCARLLRDLLHWSGRPVPAAHVELLRECASACEQALERILAGSLHDPRSYAEVCFRCADACAADPSMQPAASSCRRAAAAFQALCRISA